MFSSSSARTRHLTSTTLFKPQKPGISTRREREKIYERAREIARVYDFTLRDILTLTEKFWQMPADLIAVIDASAMILLTIQYNLAAGTLAPFVERHPDLQPLMKRILKFDISAQFLLTELAHGIDAKNLETTATLLSSGEFDLHTPRFKASKFMPPNGEVEGWDRVGIVMARLIVDGEDRGVRPFVVMLSSKGRLCKGITSRVLPSRPGTGALDHAITSFNHVRLPRTALLGSTEMPANPRSNFTSCIHRVQIGSLSISLAAIPALSVSVYIAAKHSMQRTVTMYSESGKAIATPIWSFRTQQVPIITSFARLAVMKAFASEGVSMYMDPSVDAHARFGIACCVKAFMVQQFQDSLPALAERCGAQGLYLHNQIYSVHLAMQGAVIAEGDTLALSVRAATDLILGRYTLPESRHPNTPLAKYESSLFERCQSILSEAANHRDEAVISRFLPLCRPLIEAISHRMAYEAALDSGSVHQPLLDLYEIMVIRQYAAAWFASQPELGLSAERQSEMEEAAVNAALPFVERYMRETEAEPYAQAPILSKERFREFVEGLETAKGSATPSDFSRFGSESDEGQVMARL